MFGGFCLVVFFFKDIILWDCVGCIMQLCRCIEFWFFSEAAEKDESVSEEEEEEVEEEEEEEEEKKLEAER